MRSGLKSIKSFLYLLDLKRRIFLGHAILFVKNIISRY